MGKRSTLDDPRIVRPNYCMLIAWSSGQPKGAVENTGKFIAIKAIKMAPPRGAVNTNFIYFSRWWGRQDSNLRSHEAADLQSAPFATRDTPPLNNIHDLPAKMAPGKPRMTLKPVADGELPVGAFMTESPRQSQPRPAPNPGRDRLKLPLFGTRDTSLP